MELRTLYGVVLTKAQYASIFRDNVIENLESQINSFEEDYERLELEEESDTSEIDNLKEEVAILKILLDKIVREDFTDLDKFESQFQALYDIDDTPFNILTFRNFIILGNYVDVEAPFGSKNAINAISSSIRKTIEDDLIKYGVVQAFPSLLSLTSLMVSRNKGLENFNIPEELKTKVRTERPSLKDLDLFFF